MNKFKLIRYSHANDNYTNIKGNWDVVCDLNDNEALLIIQDMKKIDIFLSVKIKLQLLYESIEELKVHIANKTNLFTIQRSVIEVLSLFYLFQETLEANVENDSVASSKIKSKFKHYHNTNFAYRFLRILRNHIIHDRFPDIYMHSYLNVADELCYELLLETKTLTAERWKGIKSQLPKIDTVNFIVEIDNAIPIIRQIAKEYINLYDIKECYYAFQRLIAFEKYLTPQDNGLFIFEISDYDSNGMPTKGIQHNFIFNGYKDIINQITI